jgi:hypothetical protein
MEEMRMTTHKEYEAEVSADYADVLGLIHERITINAALENTGGGCLAIRVLLGGSWYALITADEDVLPSPRPHGWCVGLYSFAEAHGQHRAGCEGWNLYTSTDPDPAKMIDEVEPLLGQFCRCSA